jgi:general secretion pathway protein I
LLPAVTRKQRRASAGFTIIEVLVALAIVTASLGAIGSVIATTMRTSRSLEQRVALLQTARAVETGLPRRGQLAREHVDGEIGGHRWHIDTSPFTTGGPAGDAAWVPQRVVIRVQSPSGAVLELNTVRLSRRPNR